MKKVAVIGASGQLGGHLVEMAIARGHEVLGTYYKREVLDPMATMERMDITDMDMTESVLTKFGPDTVILASGMTSIEQCESYPQQAWSMTRGRNNERRHYLQ